MKNKNTDMKNRFADTGKSYAGYFLRFVFCLVLTASALSSQAQSRNQVSGKVTDTAGEPLIGATVVVVGTTTGTTTAATRWSASWAMPTARSSAMPSRP